MKKLIKTLPIVLLLLAATGYSSYGQKPASHAKDEKLIRDHIDKIFMAYINKDTVTIRKTHSKNWRGFLSFSTTILRGIDAYMKDALPPDFFETNNQWRMVSYKMLDYDIVFHDQTGIVSYIAEIFWEDGKEKGSYKLRSVDVYGKENGEWNQIASNIGPLPTADDAPGKNQETSLK